MTPEQQKMLEQLFALDDVSNNKNDLSMLEHIINAFSAMDIAALKLLLDDFRTYQKATKKAFLEKLEELFIDHKNLGDDHLIAYSGKCDADCSHCENCGKTGYRFVGNISRNYSDFIFVLSGQNVSDIYDCSRFETNETIENLDNKADFDFYDDEEAYFIKTPEYLIKVSAAEKAFSEISTKPPQVLDFEQLNYWIKKHDNLYKSIGGYDVFQPIMKWTPFTSLYSELKEIKDYFDLHLAQIQTAYNLFNQLETEQNYIDWLLEYETIYKQAPFNLNYSSTLEEGLVSCCIDIKTTILFCGQEFLETYHFLENYETNNRALLKKFVIYTDEEFQAKFNDRSIKNIQSDLFRLNYHIQKREALAKIGVEIPFFLIKNSI